MIDVFHRSVFGRTIKLIGRYQNHSTVYDVTAKTNLLVFSQGEDDSCLSVLFIEKKMSKQLQVFLKESNRISGNVKKPQRNRKNPKNINEFNDN